MESIPGECPRGKSKRNETESFPEITSRKKKINQLEHSSCFFVCYSVGYEMDNCIPQYGIPFYQKFTTRFIDWDMLINQTAIDREDTPKNIATIR